jgi:endoglucanase
MWSPNFNNEVLTAVGTSPIGTSKVAYSGANIAGFDFGTDTCGTYNGGAQPPSDGNQQMEHFIADDGMNVFRLPVSWQYLINNNLAANQLIFSAYDDLVTACLTLSPQPLCIIDMHNYARYNGQVIGQFGPSSVEFASIWGQIANRYAGFANIAFGLMNEPHDAPCPSSTCCSESTLDVLTWTETLQAAVNSIRQNGAHTQMILIPGSDWTHTAGYVGVNGAGGSLSQFLAISDPSGNNNANLVIEYVHIIS